MTTICGSWHYEVHEGYQIRVCSIAEFCPFVNDPSIICGMTLSSKQTNIDGMTEEDCESLRKALEDLKTTPAVKFEDE